MLNLRHIEVFREVYVSGSVSAAARSMHVSQPSVSNVLRHAESRLGFLLFTRTKSRLVPTNEAHTLFLEVSEIYDRIGSLRQTARNIAHAPDGQIRVSVLPGFGLEITPLAVSTFRQQHPRVSFDIQTLHHADILRVLEGRQCDVAIAYQRQEHEKLHCTKIGQGRLVMLYRRKDFPNAPERLPLSLLEGRDFISLAHSGPLGALFSREVARLKLQIAETITISTMYVAAGLVREGLGVAVVDDFTARACMEGDLDFRPFENPMTFGIYSICLSDRPLSKVTQSFVSLLSTLLTEADGKGTA